MRYDDDHEVKLGDIAIVYTLDHSDESEDSINAAYSELCVSIGAYEVAVISGIEPYIYYRRCFRVKVCDPDVFGGFFEKQDGLGCSRW